MTQVVAAIAASAVLYVIANGQPSFSIEENGFAANGYGAHSPGGYSLTAALVCEIVMTAGFLTVILGSTDRRAPKGLGPLAIGLSLTLIHLVSIPVTNTSVNPARSTGPALFVGGWRCRSCGCSGWLRSSEQPSPASATSSSPETAASSRSRKRGREITATEVSIGDVPAARTESALGSDLGSRHRSPPRDTT